MLFSELDFCRRRRRRRYAHFCTYIFELSKYNHINPLSLWCIFTRCKIMWFTWFSCTLVVARTLPNSKQIEHFDSRPVCMHYPKNPYRYNINARAARQTDWPGKRTWKELDNLVSHSKCRPPSSPLQWSDFIFDFRTQFLFSPLSAAVQAMVKHVHSLEKLQQQIYTSKLLGAKCKYRIPYISSVSCMPAPFIASASAQHWDL